MGVFHALRSFGKSGVPKLKTGLAGRQKSAVNKAEGRGSDQVDAQIMEKMGGAPKVLNTCLAYSADGPIVKRRWPHLYTGPDQAITEPATAGD